MSTLGGTNPTLLDITKRLDPDGSVSAIAELLTEDNEILTDMPWMEGNLATGHRTTVRTGLPTAAWRKLNQGIAPSKSTTAQIDEACGMLEAYGQIDKDLAELNGNTAAFRLSENRAFIESINQTFSDALMYGDTTTAPEQFLGMTPRFADGNGPANAINVINASGSAARTSIWLVGWGANTVHGIYPKGSKAGLTHEDLGLDTVRDSSGNMYRAYVDHYQWKCGIALRDWRYVVRIANVDTSALEASPSSGANLIDLMTRALERIHSLNGVTPVFYCNRTIRSFLRRQTVSKVAGSTLQYDMVAGKPALRFAEVPVRRVDSITNAETAVSFS